LGRGQAERVVVKLPARELHAAEQGN
jgi:hypothetical protein